MQRLESRLERDGPEILAAFRRDEGGSPSGVVRHGRLSRPLSLAEQPVFALQPSVLFAFDSAGGGTRTYLGILIFDPKLMCTGATSPWTIMQDARNYASQTLRINIPFNPQIPQYQYLSTNAPQAGLASTLQQGFSPVAQDQAEQYVERTSTSYQDLTIRMVHFFEKCSRLSSSAVI